MSSTNILKKEYVESLAKNFFDSLKQDELATITCSGENVQYLRFNQSKVRQTTQVEDAEINIHYYFAKGADRSAFRTAHYDIRLTGDSVLDREKCRFALEELRSFVPNLPVDPYAIAPENHGNSSVVKEGSLPSIDHLFSSVLNPAQGVDLVGIYAGGKSVRANFNSLGQSHWFETDLFSIDYTLAGDNERIVKGSYADTQYSDAKYVQSIEQSKEMMKSLASPAKRLERGSYRVFIEPRGVASLVEMMSWHGLSEQSIRKHGSPMKLLRDGLKSFSPKLNLSENFTSGLVPRFNSHGEMADDVLPLVVEGKLKQSLVSSRSAKEFGIKSNAASPSEGLRSPRIEGGSLKREDVLKRLGTGLYLTYLHYLNWSDLSQGRITGMTRYAALWVENGKFVAPIENMRFDDTLFRMLGSELEELTEEVTLIPEVHTYNSRSLGGIVVPGALLKGMEFTL